MKRINFLILAFIFLLGGILAIVARLYNYLESTTLAFLLIAIGTFLIIAEIITYHTSMEKKKK